MNPDTLALEVRDLSCHYGNRKILDNISINVAAGTLCGLLGPNGSGKTTLFRCLLKFHKSYSGTIHIFGKDVSSQPPHKMARLVSYVPQEHHAAFPFTVKEIVCIGRTPLLSGIFRFGSEHEKAAERALELLGIPHLRDRPWNALSGGQRQLALIARAVAQESPLMILDEPTSALDFKNQIEAWKALRLLAENGFTILACCHDPNHIIWFCTQAVALKDGNILASGSPEIVLGNNTLDRLYGNMCIREKLPTGLQVVHPAVHEISKSDTSINPYVNNTRQ